MKLNGLYDEERTKSLRASAKKAVRDSLKKASGERMPPIDELFKDVYEELPPHLLEQQKELKAHLAKYPDEYNLEKFVDGEKFSSQ